MEKGTSYSLQSIHVYSPTEFIAMQHMSSSSARIAFRVEEKVLHAR